MEVDKEFSEIASLIGEPARATMLWNLTDGRAYTAGELAFIANISPQSASNHLNKLVEADFLKVEKQGKHRYYRFARTEVAHAVEALAGLIPDKKKIRQAQSYSNGDIQFCRTCYDHLAGKVAVDIMQVLLKQKVVLLKGAEFIITPAGEKWFENMGLNMTEIKKSKRHFAKPCLDWTERKYHLAGALGASFLEQLNKRNWIHTKTKSRIVVVTDKGKTGLGNLGINF